MAKEQLDHSYTYWIMPIMIFSRVHFFLAHPLMLCIIKDDDLFSIVFSYFILPNSLVFFSEWTGIGCVLLFDHFSLAINIRASPWQIDSNFLQKPWYSEKLGKKKQWCSKMKIHSVINSNEKNSCEIMYHWNIHINY